MLVRVVKDMANVKNKTEQLFEKAKLLPQSAGCYLMKNNQSKIIYIGKAKNLRARVTTYFGKTVKTPKTTILVSHIDDFEFVLTKTESEALVLENNLIKKHLPKYNVMLKDDKSYPYVIINNDHLFPRILYQRRFKRNKKTKVYGPFVTGSNISEIISILIQSFQLRTCSDREFNSRERPCLRYQMQQCSAPCVGKISHEDYQESLNAALDLISGRGEKTIKTLRQQMDDAACSEEFERAMLLRDSIVALERFIEISQQKCAELSGREKSLDVVEYYRGEDEIDLAIYMVRGGILLGHRHFYFPAEDDGVMSKLYDYYVDLADEPPAKIVTSFSKDERELLRLALESQNKKYHFVSVGRKFKDLVDLTKKFAFERQKYRHDSERESQTALLKLKELLNLRMTPKRLEAVDVAVFQGSSPTASVVSFYGGVPDKVNYRHYHLEERPEGNNDFAMMKELFERRLGKENLPDLFVVDGGLGQLKAIETIFKELGMTVPVVGIAKSRTESGFQESKVSKSKERLVIPGRSNSYDLSKTPALFRLMVQMRDEAHRFCRRLHHYQERKRIFNSWLDQVPGIGPKTKIKILQKLDQTSDELKNYKLEELVNYLEISPAQAQEILKLLKSS